MDMKRDILVCGLDEAGRGAFAGPLVLAAVVFKKDFVFPQNATLVIRDSKKLSKIQREKAFEFIKGEALFVDIEIISSDDINNKGIQWANISGFENLIRRTEADEYIVDGRWRFDNLGLKKEKVRCVIDADANIPSAIAAGIVAKVTRDRLMNNLHAAHPNYGWEHNAGYGTREHIEVLKIKGTTPYHRLKFVEKFINLP